MLAKFKLAGFTALAGVTAVLIVYAMLASERNAHAETLQQFADYKRAAADASLQQSIAYAEDTERLRAQLDAAVFDNTQLQRKLREDKLKRAAERRSADARIEELKRENEEIARWAATAIPDAWVDFMCEPTGCTAAADPLPDGS